MYPAPPKPPARQPVSHSDIVAASYRLELFIGKFFLILFTFTKKYQVYSGDGGNKISPENIEPMESSKRKHSTNSSSFSQHDERFVRLISRKVSTEESSFPHARIEIKN